MKGAAANLTLAAVAVLIVLAAAEGILRLGATWILGSGEFIEVGEIIDNEDPLLGISLIPNSERLIAKGGAFVTRDRINSLGLRDIEQPLERRTGFRRILVLGDSFAFGEGVELEECLPRLLATSLPSTEVFSAGVRAWDLGQSYLFYRYRGACFDEDLLLMMLFVNDLGPESEIEASVGEDGLPRAYRSRPELVLRRRARAPTGLTGAISSWLRSHSMLYTLARNRLDARRDLGPAKDGALTNAPHPPLLRAFHATPQGYVAESWERFFRVLDAMNALAEKRGSRLVVIVVPAPWQTSEAAWGEWVRLDWIKKFVVDPDSLSRRKPQEMVAGWCVQTGTPCLDLLETFEHVDLESNYFWPADMHWTPEGHRVAASAVHAFLVSRGLP